MEILFTEAVINLSSKWVSSLWLDNEISLSSACLEKTHKTQKMWISQKKRLMYQVLERFHLKTFQILGELSENLGRCLLSWQGCLEHGSRCLSSLDHPKWVSTLWEAAFCQAGSSPSELGKALSLTLQHRSNIFLCHSENTFFRTGNQFPSQLHF